MTDRPFDYEVDAMTRWQQFVKWMGSDKTAIAALILSLVTIMYLVAQVIRFVLH